MYKIRFKCYFNNWNVEGGRSFKLEVLNAQPLAPRKFEK